MSKKKMWIALANAGAAGVLKSLARVQLKRQFAVNTTIDRYYLCRITAYRTVIDRIGLPMQHMVRLFQIQYLKEYLSNIPAKKYLFR